MNTAYPRFDPADLAALKDRTLLSDIFAQFGVRAKGGRVKWACCPFHSERSPSFKIEDDRGRFKCFGTCGAEGDHFEALMRFKNCSFPEAIEMLGGTRTITPEDRSRAQQRQQEIDEQDRAERERKRNTVERLWSETKPFVGSYAAAYLEARGLTPPARLTADLRFVPALGYRGFPDGNAEEPVDLGQFPAMVAAIRSVDGSMIGLHRTYLDPTKPAKLAPPGDRKRNKSKKVLGEQLGGMIRLTPELGEDAAIGEGIETVLSWYVLGYVEHDISLATSVSLGNLAGRATGSIKHPTRVQPDGSPLWIPNGLPDMERPGVVLPPEVLRTILIGDGDSEPVGTGQRLLVAARRFQAQDRAVQIHMAPNGMDFSDVLGRELGLENAA